MARPTDFVQWPVALNFTQDTYELDVRLPRR
jgi:hypothetical protein